MRKIAVLATLLLVLSHVSKADPFMDRMETLRNEFARQFQIPMEWRFEEADATNAERPNFDDSSWQTISPRFSWTGSNTVWFRSTITVPATVGGQSTANVPVILELAMTNSGELYVNGRLIAESRRMTGPETLTEQAQPGQIIVVALKVKGQRHNGFHSARLYCNVLPDFNRYLDELTFVTDLMPEVSQDEQKILARTMDVSKRSIQFSDVTPDNVATVRTQLISARAALLPVAGITRKYDVYYIGHSHIDMNWLWTWAETIDTCHRTWNSAMNLMDQFPEFKYVQSQPAAYVPIETRYPDEFKRMQQMSADGRWDVVGGLWNESDTDIPSGEGLARSFLIGQTYFKSKFGKYAVTGWLPDSFGHTWQLPQLMQLSGIKYFYHMRCGNGMEMTWWQSPDGSRVLKANTPSYDAKPDLEQLVVPIRNAARFNMPQSVVVFGVGDHGGGPTRQQILRIQSYQQDPIFPKVHFIGADDYFEQLAQQPTADTLPVVDTDLQYTFEGCYTTHADIKKAIRDSENNLYSAEVLSSLAAMTGQPYPTDAFDDAWKPTAFAQFHDIAAGSAIHSSYDWMHKQLQPAVAFEEEQTSKSLATLASDVDTRGPGSSAIVVWNTLSFERDDVVKVVLAGANQYHSVTDSGGHRFPAQTMDQKTLVFVARDVPAFGHKVYFPSTESSTADGIKVNEASDTCEIESPSFDLTINKTTGDFSRLYSKPARWNVFGDAQHANAFELLGDNGTAWTIRYTDCDRILTTDGAHVSVLDNGPVFARVRVSHAYRKSAYSQDVIVYGALDRIDIPTTVDWHEKAELLKIRLPINGAHLEAAAQIPFGSKVRPVNGQECPGQKWMDVSATDPAPAADATPLNLSSLFNSRCAENFDGAGAKYPAWLLPKAGIQRLGAHQVPFNLPDYHADEPDNAVASGQQISLPAGSGGNTLFLLAARSNEKFKMDSSLPAGRPGEKFATGIGFQFAGATNEFWAFDLNNWKVATYPDNDVGLNFPEEHPGKARRATGPTMWIAQIAIPEGATTLILPQDSGFHLFAATIAPNPQAPALHGLSVLNDSKYGFDVSNGVFRLTALRSSGRPDPDPDEGIQKFTYSLFPHAGDWMAAQTDERALDLNIPLLAVVTTPHPAEHPIPSLSIHNIGGKGDLIVSALKQAENGQGYILRFYEANGRDTRARIDFDQPMQVTETDILERPIGEQTAMMEGNSVTLPVGHNRIVTLRFR
ncbi:MAG TPA: glycoside hydrolase family 38 C-terminal domain-containing protein [Verrucomicrobiae bacterium]|jgi:alpha-mannosidase|nr:glycoside hydrolase family 38 C-terminal domain-containing protein [Verrucomicrobiae bacterium]